ncbi:MULTISPECIES: DUF2993 domain-containing protein [Spirulina sp. CCY15215]|uniref:LmeA family phospholipid-binding protein n=1 Tax=Spirulina sp. CCY15215 TaxID=2767591 RepID=UPI001951AB51|nr:DUF2993 domain-containing protein [Spirulina major]
MEIIIIILSGLLSAIAPTGFALDTIIESNLRSRFAEAEVIKVRIDNTPTHQLLSGKVDRLRIATRGIEPTAGLRIAVFELETDPLSINIDRLQRDTKNFRRSFRQPVQGAVRLVLTEEDLNTAFSSPLFANRLQQAVERIAASIPGGDRQKYQLEDLQIDFREGDTSEATLGDRLQMQVTLSGTETNSQEINRVKLQIETGLEIGNRQNLKLVKPEILLNDRPLPPIFADIVEDTLGERLNWQNLDTSGIVLRLLQLEIESDRLELAAYIRIEPENLPSAPEE